MLHHRQGVFLAGIQPCSDFHWRRQHRDVTARVGVVEAHYTCTIVRQCRRGTCYNIRTVHRTTKAISSLHVVTISSKTFPVETSNLHWNCCCVFAQHHSVLSVVRCVSRENFIGYRTFRWGPSQSTTLHKGVYIMSAQTYTHMSIKWSWRDALLKHMHHKRKNI